MHAEDTPLTDQESQKETTSSVRIARKIIRLLSSDSDSTNNPVPPKTRKLGQEEGNLPHAAGNQEMENVGDTDAYQLRANLEAILQGEKEQDNLGKRVNEMYFALGSTYVSWARKLVPGLPDTAVATRSFSKVALPAVVTAYARDHTIRPLFGLKKKLERARKFFILGSLFGPDIFLEKPFLTVAWVDKIAFHVLQVLKENLVQLSDTS